MQKLYKQFVGWVIKLKLNNKIDEFFAARLGLTLYYVITAIVILGGSSIIIYNAILSNFTQSILEKGFDPYISEAIIADAKSILLDRFVTIDSIIILSTVMVGFWLTNRTLKPIKINMEKQKRFIADASHELRTPTAVIISGLEVALSNKKLDFPLAKKTLENALEEMREFSKLSNTLLDISKYDKSICVECIPIDINGLVRSIIEKSKSLAFTKRINFKIKIIDSPIIVISNNIELSRVFYNILDNAIKYTPPGGIIFISDKIVLGQYVITFNDSGIGIPKNIIHRIFDPFFRGDASRSTNGAGLGLTLVKKIIENHRGTISIKSEENKGTNVIISLPIAS
ncbi:MAG: HAMP domain-containing sensor histidine kinase [Patescibacteria group bacterium]